MIGRVRRPEVARSAEGCARSLAEVGRFSDCQAGSVGALFALLMTTMILCIGSAIDLGRWMQVNTQSQTALSAAALAGLRMLQISGGDEPLSIASAKRTFEENLGSHLTFTLDTLTFDASSDGARFSAEATGSMPTTLLRLAGIDSLPLRSPSATATSGAQSGTGPRTSYELAVAIDLSDAVSDNMLSHIKLALTDLVDIVVSPRQTDSTTRLALVPFSDTIDPGPGIKEFTGETRQGLCAKPGCQRFAFQPKGPSCDSSTSSAGECALRVFAAGRCVNERTGAAAFSDAAPTSAPLPVAYPSASGQCSGNGPTQPLSNDAQDLTRAIANLTQGGMSAPHLGIAWAWYMLSPEWGQMWSAENRAADYAELAHRTSNNRPKLRKIAILVQTARDTVRHCQGVDDRIIACNAPNGTAIQQTRRICDAMRRAGVSIYVVGVALDGNRELDAVLRNHCAGREDSFYAVGSGNELRQAIRDIALQISPAVAQ